MRAAPPPSDPLADALRDRGLSLTDHRLSNHAASLVIGPRVHLTTSELVYRRPPETPDWLLIILYRRLAARPASTLANPFADLLWFLRLCVKPRFGLSRVLCTIATARHRALGGLDDARMIRFCERVLGAGWIRYDAHAWLYRDVAPLRERLDVLRRGGQSLSSLT